jgi:hypothetical protein
MAKKYTGMKILRLLLWLLVTVNNGDTINYTPATTATSLIVGTILLL